MARTQDEKKGRHGDTILGHLTVGEIVIPRSFAQDDQFRSILATAFNKSGADLKQFIVGRPENVKNPKTGYAEFGWFKKTFGFSSKSFLGPLYGAEKMFKAPDLPKMPSVQAEQAKRTAAPMKQPPIGKGNLRSLRMGASILTKDWSKPKLGKKGLLGW